MHHATFVLPRKIAGAVKQHIRIPGGRDEFLGGQIGLTQIAKRQPFTGGKQFTRLTHGHRLQISAQHKHIGAADRFADGQRQAQFGLGARNGMAAGEGCVFRRPIAVDHGQVRAGRHHACHRCRRHYIAAGQQLAQGGKIGRSRIGHGMKQTRRQP